MVHFSDINVVLNYMMFMVFFFLSFSVYYLVNSSKKMKLVESKVSISKSIWSMFLKK